MNTSVTVPTESRPPRSTPFDGCRSLLSSRGGSIVPLVRHHDGSRLVSESEPDSNWLCTTVAGAVDETTYDLQVDFEVLEGTIPQAAVAVAFAFDRWLADDYLLLPAAVYQGNNFNILDTPYPPLWREEDQFRTDMPVTATPVPRLAADSPRLEQTTGDTASPCMGFFSPRRGFGFL